MIRRLLPCAITYASNATTSFKYNPMLIAKVQFGITVHSISKKGTFYIVQYPVLKTTQSAFTLYFPGRPVQTNTISTSQLGKHPDTC